MTPITVLAVLWLAWCIAVFAAMFTGPTVKARRCGHCGLVFRRERDGLMGKDYCPDCGSLHGGKERGHGDAG